MFGDFVGIGGHHAGVAGSAEILGRIEAKGRCVAETAGFYSSPFGAPGLGGVFDDREPARLSEIRKEARWLAVEVDRKDGSNLIAARSIEDTLDGGRIEVEGRRIDISQDRGGIRAKNCAYRGEKAKGRGDHCLPWGYARCSESEPQGVRSRGTAHGVGHVEFRCCRLLESRN